MKPSTLSIAACGALLTLMAVATAQQPRDRNFRYFDPAATQAVLPGVIQNPLASPAAHQLDRRSSMLIREWQSAEDDAARAKTEETLRAALEESFQARLKDHEQQVQELEERVKQLREQLDRRREKQDEIIDFRLQQLLREAQGLGWGTEPVTSAGGPGASGVSRVQGPVTVPDGGTTSGFRKIQPVRP